MGRKLLYATIAATALILPISCAKKAEDTPVSASKYLYMSTGLCFSGTGFTAPTIGTVGKLLSRLNLNSTNYEIIRDYGDLADEVSGTFANGITDGGDGYLYAAVENATATGNRRVDKIQKTFNGVRSTWYQNSTVLSSAMKGISKAPDNGFLVSRTTAVERFDSTPTRKMANATLAWGQTHAGACATNNTLLTSMIAMPAYTGTTMGKYIYAHSAAGQHDIGIIAMTGSIGAAECLANQAGGATLTNTATANQGWNNQLSTTATPTALVYIPTPGGSVTGKLLVAYASSTINATTAAGLSNALVMYDITETSASAATITNGQVLYHDHQYFFGVTAMAYDSSTGYLYAASSNSLATAPVGYNIEKFSIDLNTPGATRLTNTDGSSFQNANSYNNCVTSMYVGD